MSKSRWKPETEETRRAFVRRDPDGGLPAAPLSTLPERPAMTREEFEHLIATNDDVRMLVEERTSAMFETHRVDCHDCGLGYGEDGWIECVVPNDVWLKISPSGNEGGILCITCIARRIKRAGLDNVPVMLCGTEAIRVADQQESFDRGLNANAMATAELRSRLSSLERELDGVRNEREQWREAAESTLRLIDSAGARLDGMVRGASAARPAVLGDRSEAL